MIRYLDIFRNRTYRWFWLGVTFSIVGDAMTRVALTWFVYETTQSPEALGWLMFFYTAPVIVGGLIAGWLLDHFDRRRVMFFDNLIRGLVMLLVPLLHSAGQLTLVHLYLVAAVYGALMMVSLAGSPSFIPSLVKPEQLTTANALEIISYTLANIVGPPVAGWLIAGISAPNVVIVDAVSYLVFAAILFQLRSSTTPTARPRKTSFTGAFQLFATNKVLFATTLMFMSFNIGAGFVTIALPVIADRVFHGGSELYGLLLGVIALGEVISIVWIGGIILTPPLGMLICFAQISCGASLLLVLLTQNIWVASAGLILYGVFSGPLTVWAQTLRMAIIPEHLRGRTFALLRTIIQAGNPLGGALGGFLLPLMGIMPLIALAMVLIGFPGILGYNVRELRTAGSPE